MSLVGAPQDTNFARVLPIKSESRDKYSGSISDSIGCNQMGRSHLGLASVTEENNDQMGKVQLVFVAGVMGREPCILWPDRTERAGS